MYENGVVVNRHSNKMIHKQKMKDRFLHGDLLATSWSSWENYIAHSENQDYWKLYSRNGRRKYASWCSRRKVRREINTSFSLPQSKGEWKKYFDYQWTIW